MSTLKKKPNPEPEAYKPKMTVITIAADLHLLLKAKAQREGRKLGAMVETQLWKLVEPDAPLFAAAEAHAADGHAAELHAAR